MGKVWLIASGKGGVGKSTAASALGVALARLNQRVCVVDADIGLRDLDALLGVEDRVVYDLLDVANRGCSLEKALLPLPGTPGLCLLPASQFARARELSPKAFSKVASALRERFDHVLVDCPAGAERGLRGLLTCEPEAVVLVCTPDDVCIRDADRIASLMKKKGLPTPQLLVNRLAIELIERGEMCTAPVVAQTLELPLLGEIPEDISVYRAVLNHLPLMDIDCEAEEAFQRIARRMLGEAVPPANLGVKKRSWLRRMLGDTYKDVKLLDR